jgi:hypothetical protein
MLVRNPHDTIKFCFRQINYAGKRFASQSPRRECAPGGRERLMRAFRGAQFFPAVVSAR